MKFLSWLIGVPILIIVIIFAVVNRGVVAVDLWPLPWSAQLPVFLLVLGALAIGLVIGALISWFSASKARGAARREHRRADKLEQDVRTLQDEKLKLEKQDTQHKSLPNA